MIYTIFADGNLLYSSQYANDERAVINPTLKVEMGKAGALDFTLLPTHYLYTQIHEMLTEVTVACDGYELFRGRVTKVTDDFFRHRKVSCEGDLAYLLDTVTYKITDTFTPRTLLQFCIDCHNSQLLDDNNEPYCESDAKKLFVVGDVTIDEADETVSIEMSSNQSTMQTIEGFLVNVYGGFLKTRYDDGKTYLDYVKDYNYVNNQPIRFGFNMQSMEKSNDAKDLYTVLMPIGSDDLTIDSVNDGSPFIEMPGLVAKYGRIIKTHTFDNVTEPRRLLQKAQKYITDNMPGFAASETFKIKAVDMHMFDGSIDQIVVGDVVQIVSEPHGVDVTKECLSISYKLEDPSNNEYEFGVPDQTKEQKDAKASKKISSGLGYSARSAAAEVKTVSSDVKSLGTQMAKGLEDTLNKIDKNKTDIETALATAKAELNQNIANNKELIDKNAENIETNTGEIEEAFNTISSNKTSIESALETAKTNLKNLIDDNTASINKNTADIETNTGDIEEAFNTISSNKTSIESALEQTKSDFNERIKTKADKGSLIQQINESQETQTINQGKIKLTPDAVINAVNGGKDSDRTDIIKPDKIQLGSGNEKLSDKIQLDSNNNVTLSTLLVGTTGSFVTLSNGSATAPTLSTTAGGKVRIVGSGTTQYYDLDASNVGKLVTDIQVIPSGSESNTFQLQQKTIGNPSWANVSPNGTFSRATSLSGTWSGANLTVTADPQGNTYDVYHRVGLKGPTGGGQPGASFSIVMEAQTEQDTSGYVERGSSYGYLALVGSRANANVVVGPNSDGSVVVGMLPVGSLYTTGKTDGETRAKNSVLRSVEWQDDGTNVDLLLNYSDDSTEIWTVTDDSNKIANSLSLSDDVALDTSTNHVKGYAYITGSGQDVGYYIKRSPIDVDVSSLVTDVTAAKNSVKVTGPTWQIAPSPSVIANYNIATFTTDAPSPSSSTPRSTALYILRAEEWVGNVMYVYLNHTNNSDTNRLARIKVDASDLVSDATTAGRNSVTVSAPTCGNQTPAVSDNAVRTTVNIKAVASNDNSNNADFALEKGTYNPTSSSTYHCVNLKEGGTVIGRCSVQDIYTTGKSDGWGDAAADGFLPTTADTSSSSITPSIPSSTVDGVPVSRTYSLDSDNSYVYLNTTVDGNTVTVARASNNSSGGGSGQGGIASVTATDPVGDVYDNHLLGEIKITPNSGSNVFRYIKLKPGTSWSSGKFPVNAYFSTTTTLPAGGSDVRIARIWIDPPDDYGSGASHSPSAGSVSLAGGSSSLGNRIRAGSISRPTAYSYIFFTASCGGTSKDFYISVGT